MHDEAADHYPDGRLRILLPEDPKEGKEIDQEDLEDGKEVQEE